MQLCPLGTELSHCYSQQFQSIPEESLWSAFAYTKVLGWFSHKNRTVFIKVWHPPGRKHRPVCLQILKRKGCYPSFHLGSKISRSILNLGHLVTCNQWKKEWAVAPEVSSLLHNRWSSGQASVCSSTSLALCSPSLATWMEEKVSRRFNHMDELEDHPPTLSLWSGKERHLSKY